MINPNPESCVLSNHRVRDLPDCQDLVSLTFRQCTAKSWTRVGRELASLRKLQNLVLLNCNLCHSFFRELSLNRSLSHLRIGTCW